MSENSPQGANTVPVTLPKGGFGQLEAAPAVGPDANQFITFKISDEEYGVDILTVREIRAWSPVTRLPNSAEHVLGVLNLRGVILPVFDIRCKFGMGVTTPTGKHVTIVVAAGHRLVGILVDAVSEILALTEAEVKPVPDVGFSIDQEYLYGLATVHDKMVALLNIDALFGADITVLEAAGAAK